MSEQVWPRRLEGTEARAPLDTHLSVIYFGESFVYKVKKPIKLDVVDFSTLALREKACAREVRLNQRLSGDVHQDVLPLFEQNGGWSLQGAGDPVEFCVRMKRLPAEKMMDVVVRNGELTQQHIEALAKQLGPFYLEAKTSEKIARTGLANSIESFVRNNLKSLRDLHPELAELDLLDSALMEFVALHQEAFTERANRGRVRDGHGDLRPEHICLTDPPVIFDCIEFHDRYRHLDVMDDIAGLVMELDRLGWQDHGQKLRDQLTELLDESIAPELFDFYRAYRAVSRAKFEAIQIEAKHDENEEHPIPRDEPLDEAIVRQTVTSYVKQAAEYAKSFHRPKLLITFGLKGTGKSTLSQALSHTLGVKRLSSQGFREKMYTNSNGSEQSRRGVYNEKERDEVYTEVFKSAEEYLSKGISVVLDASFTTNRWRNEALELARRTGSTPLFLECRLPKSDAIARLDQRFKKDRTNASIRPEYYEEHQKSYEPADHLPPDCHLTLTTTVSVPELVDAVVEAFSSQASL